ncbi:MAG TPA: cytochrome c nitrite reductase small subunit [Rhodothermales bacterium]
MRPGQRNLLVLSVLLGIAIGVGVFTIGYARGYSYLTNDPAACANCHIMDEHFASWTKSSHRAVAVCNDCHTPHDIVGKYVTKASNGFWHSFAFTTGNFPDPLRIKPGNLKVTEEACRDCHADVTAAITMGPHLMGVRADPDARHFESTDLQCTRCHSTVGHLVR